MVEEGQEEEEEDKEMKSMKFYMTDMNASFKIIETKWVQFVIITGILYLYHLIWTMAGVNAFSSQTRFIACGSVESTDKDVKDKSSAILDTAIALTTIFHMIDWVRWTLMLTAALVGVNLLKLYYLLTAINFPLGIIAMLIAIVTRYGEEGDDCAAEGKQPTRAFYLGL